MKDSFPEDKTFSWHDKRDTDTDDPPAWSLYNEARALFSLENFVGEAAPVDLNDCTLRLLTDGDLDSIRQTVDDPGGRTFFRSLHSSWDDFRGLPMPWVLDVPLPAGPFDAAISAAMQICRKFESAFRLVAGGASVSLHLPLVYQSGVSHAVTGLLHLRPYYPSWAEVSGETPFTLDAQKSAELRDFYDRQQTVTDARLRLAIRRFNIAYQRDLPEDALIDCWIALEAMFSEGAGGIRFKAAMRVAYYIDSRKGKDRPKIFNELYRSYEVRNHLVHGVTKDLDAATAYRWALTGLALALRRALRSGATPDLPELNQLIAQGAE